MNQNNQNDQQDQAWFDYLKSKGIKKDNQSIIDSLLETGEGQDLLNDIEGLSGIVNFMREGRITAPSLQNILQGNFEDFEHEGTRNQIEEWAGYISDIIGNPEQVVAHNPLVRGLGEVAAYNQFQQELLNTEEGQRYSNLEAKFANNDNFGDIMDSMDAHGTTGDPTIDKEYNEMYSLKDSLDMKLRNYGMSQFPEEDMLMSSISPSVGSRDKARQFTTDAVNKLHGLINEAGLDPNTYGLAQDTGTLNDLIGQLYETDIFAKSWKGPEGQAGARDLDKLSRFGDIYQTSLMRDLK